MKPPLGWAIRKIYFDELWRVVVTDSNPFITRIVIGHGKSAGEAWQQCLEMIKAANYYDK